MLVSESDTDKKSLYWIFACHKMGHNNILWRLLKVYQFVLWLKTKDITFGTCFHRLWGDCHQGHAPPWRPVMGVDGHSTEGSHLVHKLAQGYDGEIEATEQKHCSWEVRCKQICLILYKM